MISKIFIQIHERRKPTLQNKKRVNLRECAIKTPFDWRPAESQYLTCHHMTMISDLVVKEAQKCPIFRRSGKIHILILWHLQQSSVSSGVQDALLNQSMIRIPVHDTVFRTPQPAPLQSLYMVIVMVIITDIARSCFFLKTLFLLLTKACYRLCKTLSDFSHAFLFLQS